MTRVSPGRVRHILIDLYDSRCQYCGLVFDSPNDLAVEHIVARSKGGLNALENYTIACNGCNSRKRSLDLPEPGKSLLIARATAKAERVLRALAPKPSVPSRFAVEPRASSFNRVAGTFSEPNMLWSFAEPVLAEAVEVYCALLNPVPGYYSTTFWETVTSKPEARPAHSGRPWSSLYRSGRPWSPLYHRLDPAVLATIRGAASSPAPTLIRDINFCGEGILDFSREAIELSATWWSHVYRESIMEDGESVGLQFRRGFVTLGYSWSAMADCIYANYDGTMISRPLLEHLCRLAHLQLPPESTIPLSSERPELRRNLLDEVLAVREDEYESVAERKEDALERLRPLA